jgi:cyanate permease
MRAARCASPNSGHSNWRLTQECSGSMVLCANGVEIETSGQNPELNRESLQVTATAFLVLFCIVGMALCGLPYYYDFMAAVWLDAGTSDFRQCFEQTGGGIVPLVTAEIFGMQFLGRLLGVILTTGSVAEAVSPWLVGRLRDTTGSYTAGFLTLVGMAILGAAAIAGLPRGQKSI